MAEASVDDGVAIPQQRGDGESIEHVEAPEQPAVDHRPMPPAWPPPPYPGYEADDEATSDGESVADFDADGDTDPDLRPGPRDAPPAWFAEARARIGEAVDDAKQATGRRPLAVRARLSREWLVPGVVVVVVGVLLSGLTYLVVAANRAPATPKRQQAPAVAAGTPRPLATAGVLPDSPTPSGEPTPPPTTPPAATQTPARTATTPPGTRPNPPAAPAPVPNPVPVPPPAPPPPPPPIPPAPPKPAELHAKFARVGDILVGYRGQVTISNVGGSAADDWHVVVSLPDGQTVNIASGAGFVVNGQTITFTPVDSTRVVAGNGGQVKFTFDVIAPPNAPGPTCTIDGRPCD